MMANSKDEHNDPISQMQGLRPLPKKWAKGKRHNVSIS
jgi:hypothetical protein